MTALRAMPVLQVKSVSASVAFYQTLQFTLNGVWGDPASFAIVQMGHVTIGMERVAQPPNTSASWSAYVYVKDVDTLHAAFVAADVQIDRAPMNRFFGCRDFELSDPDGHRICFGQDLSPTHGPGLAAVKEGIDSV